jgi:hypothetical protein
MPANQLALVSAKQIVGHHEGKKDTKVAVVTKESSTVRSIRTFVRLIVHSTPFVSFVPSW